MTGRLPLSVHAFMIVICYFLVANNRVHARSINDALGTTSFSWLKAIDDAEISAAGECLAARDEKAALLIHPAAVAGITTGTAKLSYVSHYVDTQYGSVGFARQIKKHCLGFRLTYVNYGEFTRTNKLGEKTGTFTAGDMGFSVNLGKQVRNDLKIGATVSYLTSKLEDFTAQAVTADLGLLFYPPFEGFTLGAVLTNLGKVTKSYSSGHNEILPVTLTVGGRKKLVHSPFTLMVDVIFPNDNDITYALGLEASVKNTLFLYTGTKSRNDIDIVNRKAETDYSGFTTFGFGIALDRVRFNYAYCPDEAFEDIHKITLSVITP